MKATKSAKLEPTTLSRLQTFGYSGESINFLTKLLLWGWQNPKKRMYSDIVGRRMFFPPFTDEEETKLLASARKYAEGRPLKTMKQVEAETEKDVE